MSSLAEGHGKGLVFHGLKIETTAFFSSKTKLQLYQRTRFPSVLYLEIF